MDLFHHGVMYLSSEAREDLLFQRRSTLSSQGTVSIKRSVRVSSALRFDYPPSRREACCTMTRDPPLLPQGKVSIQWSLRASPAPALVYLLF